LQSFSSLFISVLVFGEAQDKEGRANPFSPVRRRSRFFKKVMESLFDD